MRLPAACAALALLVAALAADQGARAATADGPLPGAPADSAATAIPAAPAVAAPAVDGSPGREPSPGAPSPAGNDGEAGTQANLWDTGVDATGAVLMTPLFPGWGQLYADGGWRAALAFGAEMYFWSNLLSRDRQARRDLEFAATLPGGDPGRTFAESLAAEHHEQMKDFVWWSGGALLIIALDAYVGAHLFNFDQDAVPVPDRWEDVFGPVGSGPAVSAGAGPEVTVFQWRKGF